MPLLNDGDILTLPEIKEAKTVKIFTATGEEIKYFVYAPQMSIASLPGGFYTVYILNNAGAVSYTHLFAIALLFMAVGILVMLLWNHPALPEITDGLHNTCLLYTS